MTESSPLQTLEEQKILQAALEHPFEPAEVPHSSISSSPSPSSAPPSQLATSASEGTPTQDSEDTWQAAYSAQVSEWRAQSASARDKAELTRAKWEAIRAHEDAERKARGEPPESTANLGEHLTASAAAASGAVAHTLAASVTSLGSIEHIEAPDKPEESTTVQDPKGESGSPSQRWEHISPSPTSSYPSMSFPEASVPHSPAPQPALLAPASVEMNPLPDPPRNQTYIPPSLLPSITDNRIQPRTRLSLVLSSLAINLLLPFINGVMLGFGEIFAKDVVVGWFGWKSGRGSIAASLGLRR